jgi:hypothetical protein
VNHERLDAEECRLVLGWHRFGLRCRDLFRPGFDANQVDTSWYELSDEN